MFFKIKKIDIDEILNFLIILYAFLLPLSRAAINIIGAIIIFIFFILLKKKKTDLKINKTYLIFFLFGIFLIISYLWTDDFRYATFYTLRYWQYLLISFIIYLSLEKEYIPYVISAFITGLFISEIISYSISLGIIHKTDVCKDDPTPFMNHIEYSFYLSIGAIFIIDQFFKMREWNLKRFFLILFFLSISINLFLINGRTGQFVYLIIIFLISVIYFKLKLKNIFFNLLGGFLIFFIVYQLSPNFRNKFQKTLYIFSEKINPCSADGNRVYMIKVGMDIFLHNPLIGVGVGDVMKVFREYVDKEYPFFKCSFKYNHLHNQYIQILVQVGVIGIILFLLGFYFLFKESEDKKLAFLLIIAIILSFNGDVLLSRQFSIALIFFLIAIILRKENGQYNNYSFK